MVKKFEVYLVNHKTEKPCVIISPEEINEVLPYVLVIPITKKIRNFPCRLGVKLKGEPSQLALDLMQTVAKEKLVQKVGSLPDHLKTELSALLKTFFSDVGASE